MSIAAPTIGFLNRDEAHILYNTALMFSGRPALEIGCWMGWSACHLALGGVRLDGIDPLLAREDFRRNVADSLPRLACSMPSTWWPAASPEQVHALAAHSQRKWSLIFIDGNHDGPHPFEDTIACLPYAAEDALILFHDLVSSDVAKGSTTFGKKVGVRWYTKPCR